MRSSITAQSLLSLPSELKHPSPYTVFGLAPGESNATAIAQAIGVTVTRLNAAKSTADPAAWQQAAVWVKRARDILLDPTRKARLDQSMLLNEAEGQTRPAAASPSANDRTADDPLAGLLPGVGTAASPQPPAAAAAFRAGPARLATSATAPATAASSHSSLGPQRASSPPGGWLPAGDPAQPPNASAALVSESPPPSTPVAAETLTNQMPLPIQVIRSDIGSGRRRRRRFPLAGVVLTLMTVISVGGIAGMIYLLNQNPAGIVINFQPHATDASSVGSAVAAPAPAPAGASRPPSDPIMGRLGREPSRSQGRSGDHRDRLAAADDWLAGLTDAKDAMPVPSAAAIATEPAMAPLAPSPDEGDEPLGGDGAQATIAQAREAIGNANWATMQGLAEAAERAAVTDEQKTQASQLHQLAELASYYHGGIEKGLDGLGAGESFDVTDQLQIVVVEIGPEKVVFRFSGRNKEYSRRELPLVLAHRIARFAMPAETPTTTAAANAYQGVAPISTPQYRQQAIAALESMTEEVEGAKATDVAAAIRDVFGE